MLTVNNRLWKPALAAALICALLIWGLLAWTDRDKEQDRQSQITAQTAGYLTTLYELLGDWTPVIERMTANELDDWLPSEVVGGKLALWTADNRLLWNDIGQVEESGRHILLQNGLVIGYFSLDVEKNWTDKLVWLPPFLVFSAVLAVVYAVLSSVETGYLQFGNRIRQKLAALDSSSQNTKLSGSGSDGQVVTKGVFVSEKLNDLELSLNQQLKRLDDRLFRLETIRKSMVADIAHELRTPLAVMRAQLDNAMEKQDSLNPAQLSLLQDEVFRMSKLLSDLQQLALAESGNLTMNQSWFSLYQLLVDIQSAFELQAEESSISLTLDCPASARIYADENRLRQVFVNLVGNALRYARNKIVISVELDAEASSYKIRIADDGKGIEEEELPYIFERFYRGTSKNGLAPAPSGLGLGLPIVKQLIEAHHGQIKAASRWNEGTEFFISLPVFYEHSSRYE